MANSGNGEILDATRLVFGYGYEGFESYSESELEGVNSPDSDGTYPSKVLGMSMRELTAYDPAQNAIVTAVEVMGIGHEFGESRASLTAVHGVFLAWDDESKTECLIDLNTEKAHVVHQGEVEDRADIGKEPEWRQRILGALAVLADKIVDI